LTGRDPAEGRAHRRERRRLRAENADAQLLCSFCGKSQRQVTKLIAGPGVYICNECVDLCIEIFDEQGVESRADIQVGLERIPALLDAIKDNQRLLASHQNELADLIEAVGAELEVERLKREE
jgi:hypothetical protein